MLLNDANSSLLIKIMRRYIEMHNQGLATWKSRWMPKKFLKQEIRKNPFELSRTRQGKTEKTWRRFEFTRRIQNPVVSFQWYLKEIRSWTSAENICCILFHYENLENLIIFSSLYSAVADLCVLILISWGDWRFDTRYKTTEFTFRKNCKNNRKSSK